MSKDVRHDDQSRERHDSSGHHRLDSEGDRFDAQSSSAYISVGPAQTGAVQPIPPVASTSQVGHYGAAAHDGNRLGTLTQGVGFESDDEHNPFLDRRRPAGSSTSEPFNAAVPAAAAPAHHSHPYYDEYDSDQDAEGSVHEDDSHDFTPRASSSHPTTPPPRTHDLAYRPARPFSTRVRVDNEPVTSTMPIRDTPKNPFLAGGPADQGFHGPNGHLARRRAQQMPGKERGKIAYVFRGQRVTYADPEYDSDDDDSDDDRARTNEFNPHHNPSRPPRLQPKLLFPPTAASSSKAQPASAGRRGNASSAYLPRAELAEDAFGGSTSSSSYEEESYAPRSGGGLFAAQIAAQRKKETAAPTAVAPHSRSNSYDVEAHPAEGAWRREAVAPSSSTRLQSVTQEKHTGAEARQAARDALLARLDQTNWSDDDEDDDERDASYGRRRARDGSEESAEEDAHRTEMESYALVRSQSHKRFADELQAGHADEVDALGRPMKRSRASYAH